MAKRLQSAMFVGSSQSAITVTGAKELDDYFRTLPDRLQRKGARQAVAAGAQVLVKQVRQNVKTMTKTGQGTIRSRIKKGLRSAFIISGGLVVRTRVKTLAQSITKRAWSVPEKGLIGQVVGAEWPHGAHAHLVEYGHDVYINGRNTGKRTRPIPFQRRAMTQSRGAALQAEAAKMRQFISKERKRA